MRSCFCEAMWAMQNLSVNCFKNRIDSIVYLAAAIVVPGSIEHPLSYYRNKTRVVDRRLGDPPF